MSDQTDQPEQRAFLGYGVARKRSRHRDLTLSTIPVGHELSLPCPTRRWSTPAFAVFASPARRQPPASLEVGTPDRWWVVDARSAGLLAYNQVDLVPFGALEGSSTLVIEGVGRSIAEIEQDLASLDELMDRALVPFFTEGSVPSPLAEDLGHAFRAVVRPGSQRWYEALAPDFFEAIGPIGGAD